MKFLTLPQAGDMYAAYIVLKKPLQYLILKNLLKTLLQFNIIYSARPFFLKSELLWAIFVISSLLDPTC